MKGAAQGPQKQHHRASLLSALEGKVMQLVASVCQFVAALTLKPTDL